jgi:hypothetical protein
VWNEERKIIKRVKTNNVCVGLSREAKLSLSERALSLRERARGRETQRERDRERDRERKRSCVTRQRKK